MAHPSLILYEKGGFSPAMWVYRNVNWMYLPYIQDIYIHCETGTGTKRKKTWMKNATCRSSTRSLQKAKRISHGPKIGATNLEAGLPILVLWPRFWVQNLAPVLGPQNTNRSYSIRAASALLPPQADSSTYPWYSGGTMRRSLLYHLFEAPVLGPWAHLGFEKKCPQCLNKKPTKTWGTNRNGLDVKLLSISRETTKARVANHNDLDAELLRSSWKTTKAWAANHNGPDAKLLRMSLKIEEMKRIQLLFYPLEQFLSSFAAEPIRIAKSSLVAFDCTLSSIAAKPIRNATPCLVAFEHILSSFAAKPILLPRDVCGYAHENMAPLINVATHKSQSCCLSWCSCFAEGGSKSTLMSGGAGGCAQGPVLCRWLCTCLCIACGSQSSTSHACCRTAWASLHLLKRSFGLRCDAGPFLGLWACMLFAFLHCVPCM